MPILKISKRDRPFLMMDKRPLSDTRLSWKAKGLLAYLLSKPDDWEVWVNDLTKHSTDGEHAVRSAIQELRDAGYISYERVRQEDGTLGPSSYLVKELPQGGFQEPNCENPNLDNHHHTKNDLTNTTSISNEIEGYACPDCGLICKSKGGLTRHRRSRHEAPPENEAVREYRALTGCRPVEGVRQQIIDTVTDWGRWQLVVTAYCGMGWNPRNVKAMLEFYQRNEIPGGDGNGRDGGRSKSGMARGAGQPAKDSAGTEVYARRWAEASRHPGA